MFKATSALIVLAGLVALSSATPFLLAYKTFYDLQLVVGHETTIVYHVFNTGDSSAYDVKLDDTSSWNEEAFEGVSGLPVVQWSELAAGANVSHTYTIKPIKAGDQRSEPAQITYRDAPAKGTLQRGNSNTLGLLPVQTSRQASNEGAHFIEWGVYAVAAAAAILLPFQYYQGVRGSAKKML